MRRRVGLEFLTVFVPCCCRRCRCAAASLVEVDFFLPIGTLLHCDFVYLYINERTHTCTRGYVFSFLTHLRCGSMAKELIFSLVQLLFLLPLLLLTLSLRSI